MGWLMYYKDDRDQLGIDDFFLPFGGKLKKDNRWVRMSEIMPWDYIEEVYLRLGMSCAALKILTLFLALLGQNGPGSVNINSQITLPKIRSVKPF